MTAYQCRLGSGRFVTTNSLPDVSLRAVRYGVFSLRGTFVTKTFDTELVSLHNAFVTRSFVVHMASFSWGKKIDFKIKREPHWSSLIVWW